MKHWLAIAFGLAMSAAAQADSPAAAPVCVQVEGADSSAYLNCLNADLAHQATQEQARAQSLQTVVDGAAPATDLQKGLYNQAATRERLRGNFGHGVRPPPPGK
jgi:hypothetical protein